MEKKNLRSMCRFCIIHIFHDLSEEPSYVYAVQSSSLIFPSPHIVTSSSVVRTAEFYSVCELQIYNILLLNTVTSVYIGSPIH